MNSVTDVIAAVSTPPGKGGVAVIRMSGEGAVEIAERVFSSASGKRIADYKPRTQIYGYITDGGEQLDDVLLTYFAAPHSYTGEDTVEISCHGGILITRTVLEVLLAAGARAAEAGEFTRRAFIGGRLSLTEAEAIGTLLEAASKEQIRLSSGDARGRLAEAISGIRSGLLDIMSSIYARIDYPDEDLGDFDDAELLSRLYNIKERISTLKDTYRTGRAITEGIGTALVGKPNVGKSTIYNLLVGEEAAIVTEIEGTTRDILERTVPLGRIILRLADTAGIRERDGLDTVERIGIERSRQKIADCELLFAIFDLSRPFDKEDEELIAEIKKAQATKIAILNKADSEGAFDHSVLDGKFDRVIKISAKKDGLAAIRELRECADELFTDEKIKAGKDPILASARQHAAISRALEFTDFAIKGLESGFAQDAASTDIERALGAISELDGRAVNEEVVADIFSKFCVGK